MVAFSTRAAPEPIAPVEQARITLSRVPADRCLVGLSGGKDSLVTLDLCVERFGQENVAAFTMVLVPDLDVEWKPIREALRRYPKVEVFQVYHPELYRLVRYGIYRLQDAPSIPLVKMKHVEAEVRDMAGMDFIAYGWKSADSINRRASLRKLGVFEDGTFVRDYIDRGARKVYPIATFKKADIGGYLHGKGLPVPAITGGGAYSGGVSLDAKVLLWLKKHYPQDYEKICAFFPLAKAAVFRAEAMQGRKPAVRTPCPSPKP